MSEIQVQAVDEHRAVPVTVHKDGKFPFVNGSNSQPEETKTTSILDEAQKLTSEDRQSVYGHPAEDFAKVAKMTTPISDAKIDPRLKHALYMIQVKVARLLNTPDHLDSVIDIAGYANTYAMILERMKDDDTSTE